jgi:hypothetical protein
VTAVGRLARTDGLTETQRDILATVHDFVDKQILPVATRLSTPMSTRRKSSTACSGSACSG